MPKNNKGDLYGYMFVDVLQQRWLKYDWRSLSQKEEWRDVPTIEDIK